MRIIFWENIISQHKLPYWRKIKNANSKYELIVAVPVLIDTELQIQGWNIEINNEFEIIVNPNDDKIETLLKENFNDSIHIFSGIKANAFVYKVFLKSLRFEDIKRVLITESINLDGSRMITRRLASFFIERKYRNYFDLVLASGQSTPAWYKECGYNPERVFPFMYSIDPLPEYSPVPLNSVFKIIFVGQLIKRKGLDLLINSLHQLNEENWKLDIYGTGGMEKKYLKMIDNYGLADRITLKGVLNNEFIKKVISKYDLLVLPSRFDGWGAVINEALAAGTKAVCSNSCGASVLINNDIYGAIFRKNNTLHLTLVLKEQIQKGCLDEMQRLKIHEYGKCLSGLKVAQYLIDIIEYHYNMNGSIPIAPWESIKQI